MAGAGVIPRATDRPQLHRFFVGRQRNSLGIGGGFFFALLRRDKRARIDANGTQLR